MAKLSDLFNKPSLTLNLNDLENVDTSNESNSDILLYDSGNSRYENRTLSGGEGISISLGTVSIDKNEVSSYTISTSNPSGGEHGDIWYKV